MDKVRRSKQPLISRAKSSSLPFQVAAACWVDLLGYGEMIGAAELNPANPKAKEAIERLRIFHGVVAQHSGRYYRTLVLNDGAVAHRDLSLRGSSVTYDFFARSFRMFEAIQMAEHSHGWPGARMVLAAGFRAKGSRRAIDLKASQLESILARLKNREITAEQAVREAATIERYFDVLPQLQANFAFTKAYAADSAGRKGGFEGARFYVENAIFDTVEGPSWITTGNPVHFQKPHLSIDTTFLPVSELSPPSCTSAATPGMRDGLQIAEAIAPNHSVRKLVQMARAAE